MRINRYKILIVLVAVGFITLFSVNSHSGVVGSKHDLTAFTGTGIMTFLTQQVCVFCHTPHSARTDVTALTNPLLLWNRSLSNASTYKMYKSPTTQNNTGTTPRIYTRLCLSCHDGIGALNVMARLPNDEYAFTTSYGGATRLEPSGGLGIYNADQIGDRLYSVAMVNSNIGERQVTNPDTDPGGNTTNTVINLSNDHPVSFDYDYALYSKDSGLKDPTKIWTINATVRLFSNGTDIIPTSMECSTCHNPHNEGDQSAGTYPFLVKTMNNSELCLNCHIK